MPKFKGFKPSYDKNVDIPEQFFSELLDQIDTLSELKITLYSLQLFDRMEGEIKYILKKDLRSNENFMHGLDLDPDKALNLLAAGLNSAVKRGTLLSAEVDTTGKNQTIYIINSKRGKAALGAIMKGDWQPTADDARLIKTNIARPNLFGIYEGHIGPLSPMISDAIQDAELEYSSEWVEDAIKSAVKSNVRKWNYIEAILKRWQEEGKYDRADQGDSKKSGKKYVEGKFSDFIEH